MTDDYVIEAVESTDSSIMYPAHEAIVHNNPSWQHSCQQAGSSTWVKAITTLAMY